MTHLAGSRGVVRLEGTAASTAGLLGALPRARWAHIATHGFFADPAVPSVLRPDPKLFARSGATGPPQGAQPAGPLGAGPGRGQSTRRWVCDEP